MMNAIMGFFTSSSPRGLEEKVELQKEIAEHSKATPIQEKIDPVLQKILDDGFKYERIWRSPVELYRRGKDDFLLYCPVHKNEIIRYGKLRSNYAVRKCK